MARLIIGANELLPGTQVITESGVTITPKDGLEVLLAIDDVIPASVTLDSGTSLSQKVHVMNKSGNACTLIYTSQNGTSSIALNTNQAASLVWTGDHWNATFSGLITGTDADGNSINYDTDITLDVAPRSRDDYSTSEIFTGQYWIDGKKIYRMVVMGNTGTLSYGTTASINLTSAINYENSRLIHVFGTVGYAFPLNWYYTANYSGNPSTYPVQSMWIDITSTYLRFIYNFTTSAYANAFSNKEIAVIAEYTKVTN